MRQGEASNQKGKKRVVQQGKQRGIDLAGRKSGSACIRDLQRGRR